MSAMNRERQKIIAKLDLSKLPSNETNTINVIQIAEQSTPSDMTLGTDRPSDQAIASPFVPTAQPLPKADTTIPTLPEMAPYAKEVNVGNLEAQLRRNEKMALNQKVDDTAKGETA